MTNIFEKYDLDQVINASEKMTTLGVLTYIDEAIEARTFGSKNFFEMNRLSITVYAAAEQVLTKYLREVMNQLKSRLPAIYMRKHRVNNNGIEFDIRLVNKLEIDLILKKLYSIMGK